MKEESGIDFKCSNCGKTELDMVTEIFEEISVQICVNETGHAFTNSPPPSIAGGEYASESVRCSGCGKSLTFDGVPIESLEQLEMWLISKGGDGPLDRHLATYSTEISIPNLFYANGLETE